MVRCLGAPQPGKLRIVHGIDHIVLDQLAAQFAKHELREAFNPAVCDLQEHAEDSFIITITGALRVSEGVACDTPAHFSHSADDL